MPSGTYTVKLPDRKIQVATQELSDFRDLYLGTFEIGGPMSELIWLDVYTWEKVHGISASQVLYAIHDLEQGEVKSRTNPATQFSRLPLKGLWHKHVLTARSVPMNLSTAWGKGRLRKMVTDVLGEDGSPITQEKLVELKDRIVYQAFDERSAANQVTGEWIVYLPHEGKNFYLGLGSHKDGDQFIYDRILEHCPRDFPSLSGG
jgi:hypothetical protein